MSALPEGTQSRVLSLSAGTDANMAEFDVKGLEPGQPSWANYVKVHKNARQPMIHILENKIKTWRIFLV
jgi:hypothetical protein